MDPRMKERRRGVSQARGRRRLVGVALVLLVLGGVGGFLWARSSDVFAVRRVSVPVTQRVSAGDLRAAVDEAAGSNLLRISTDRIEARVRSIPYVRAVRVYRRFPDSLDIDIVEYVPVARIEGRDGARWLLGEDGRVLGTWDEVADPASSELPMFVPEAEVWPEPGVVTAPQIVEALSVATGLVEGGAWPVARHPVNEVRVTREGEIAMVLAGGGEIRLGDPRELDEKLTVALAVVDGYLSQGKKLEYVDVHVPARPVAVAK